MAPAKDPGPSRGRPGLERTGGQRGSGRAARSGASCGSPSGVRRRLRLALAPRPPGQDLGEQLGVVDHGGDRTDRPLGEPEDGGVRQRHQHVGAQRADARRQLAAQLRLQVQERQIDADAPRQGQVPVRPRGRRSVTQSAASSTTAGEGVLSDRCTGRSQGESLLSRPGGVLRGPHQIHRSRSTRRSSRRQDLPGHGVDLGPPDPVQRLTAPLTRLESRSRAVGREPRTSIWACPWRSPPGDSTPGVRVENRLGRPRPGGGQPGRRMPRGLRRRPRCVRASDGGPPSPRGRSDRPGARPRRRHRSRGGRAGWPARPRRSWWSPRGPGGNRRAPPHTAVVPTASATAPAVPTAPVTRSADSTRLPSLTSLPSKPIPARYPRTRLRSPALRKKSREVPAGGDDSALTVRKIRETLNEPTVAAGHPLVGAPTSRGGLA